MIFSGGLTFWWVLTAAVVMFWVLPVRRRMGFLSLTSFVFLFFVTQRPAHVLILLGCSLVFYVSAPRAARPGGKWILPTLVLGMLAYLGFYKYLPPLLWQGQIDSTVEQVFIPLGISYFTFKLIHYAIEVSRDNSPAHSIVDFLGYVFLFSIFSAGPIERFDHFLNNREQGWCTSSLVWGLTRIVGGFIKKFFLVEYLLNKIGFEALPTSTMLLQDLSETPTITLWAFCACSFLRAYWDFSAYSDIAIGTSRLFGFQIMENFNWPIFAPNISNFWQRWHMTLSGWCQTYVYLPTIGLTRRPIFSVYAAFVVIGLWHAGSMHYLLWGLYQATGVTVYQSWARLKRRRGWSTTNKFRTQWLGIALTMTFVVCGQSFTALHGVGDIGGSLRLLFRLFLIKLPD